MTNESEHMENVVYNIENKLNDCDGTIPTLMLAAGRLNSTYCCNNEITDQERYDFQKSLESLGRQFNKNCSCSKK